ncbi:MULTISPECIES: NAD(P)-dependent oxidoreductase [unclassified Sphingomonas]|uniref:NAD(P)-dependent oxidoreductase n=1 Tax=unclassified Sphingomonas TaxID=196159 RepID=UPI0006F57412|nr:MULTISPECIES: DUF1932 domain-containing protein [unclassified Sphingomonas]KQX23237.1 6-phosphogluconate dehydrogenase [Sphingomonas sp. Root1294]KQY68085.1 6-phosphogluconate dehydrogenase [Sphingomonas sp. Root50]KRB90977.1 6-phosphogluconate dehydrogenase [Sphingomonas sp. Root720]
MDGSIAHIGFGEAGMAFARPGARAYDRSTDDGAMRDAKRADYVACRVVGCADATEALAGVDAVLSLVTADQSLAAARTAAPLLKPGAIWFDMNSVAPDTKRQAADAIEAAGGRHVDVAVMAPVHPRRLGTPLLVAGKYARAGADALRAMGFVNVRIVGGDTGAASAIKMIRSVMVKGIEALTAECLIAADAAGVTADVLASLDVGAPEAGWEARADYNLDRMLVHGRRRAAEMEEVVRTIEALGTGAAMSRATAERQRAIGSLGVVRPPEGLDGKLGLLRNGKGLAA